jgi:hypothetical protein
MASKSIEIKPISWILWTVVVLVGAVVVAVHAYSYQGLLMNSANHRVWPFLSTDRVQYVATRSLHMNHRIAQCDLERPKAPSSVAIDTPTTVLRGYLRHDVCHGEPVLEKDVADTPHLAARPGYARMAIPTVTAIPTFNGAFDAGQPVTIVVQGGGSVDGTILAVADTHVLVEVSGTQVNALAAAAAKKAGDLMLISRPLPPAPPSTPCPKGR